MPCLPAVKKECATITSSLVVSRPSERGEGRIGKRRRVALAIDGFAAEAIEEEAVRLGISAEELVNFSVLYYLADVDSGRIARSIPRSLDPDSALDELRSR